MLEMLLDELHNWFPVRGAAQAGAFTISGGALHADGIAEGQYYRIQGSVFNDGLHQRGAEQLTDEAFSGVVTPLAVPRAVAALADEIAAWRAANPETDKISESFGGYSYTRAAASDGAQAGWRAAFAAQLSRWRRPCE